MRNKINKVIINANNLAAQEEWDAAEKLLLEALQEEESELYLVALKSIYQSQKRYVDENRIHNRLLYLKSSLLKPSQQLEVMQSFDLMPSLHDLEYLEQASQSLAPLEWEEEFTLVEPTSTVSFEQDKNPESEIVAKPKESQQLSIRSTSWLDDEPDEEFEVDESEILPMDLFGEADEDNYDVAYIVADDLNLLDEHNKDKPEQSNVFEDEFYFYQFDPDELLADNDSLPTDITSTARLTREERALQKAAEFVSKFDWPNTSLPLLKRIFYLYGWGATRVALEREVEKGLSPNELALATHLKVIWAENEMYWIAFDAAGSFNLSQSAFSWPTTLLIVRSFDELPQLAELEVLMEELFEAWYKNRVLCRVFKSFVRYLWFRFSGLKGTLPVDLRFDFLPPSELPVEEYSDLGSYDILEIEKHSLLSEYGLL